MVIDIDNGVFYSRDTPDWTKYATQQGPVPDVTNVRQFAEWEGLGDIVTVNGRPMRGTWHSRAILIRTAPNPVPPIAIADVTRGGTLEWIMEIHDVDGNRLGCIMGYGWNGGVGPAGGDQTRMFGLEMTITGGTGAFVGIRGQMAVNSERSPGAPAYRGNASMVEDPGYRRVNGPGQTRRHVLQVYPMVLPTIDHVLHADFTPVNADQPARPGEMLVLWCSNLGPVRPNVEFGKPFPSEPLAEVNAPVDIIVNGREVPAVNKIGVPGQVNQYRVDLQLPPGTAPGEATLQLKAAFLDGVKIQIPVR